MRPDYAVVGPTANRHVHENENALVHDTRRGPGALSPASESTKARQDVTLFSIASNTMSPDSSHLCAPADRLLIRPVSST